MANCVNYNCEDQLGDHLLNDCGEELQGGIESVIFLECDNQLTDPSDAVEVQAELDAGRATLVKNVKLSLDAPTPVKIASNVACAPDKIVRYDRTGSYVDGNVNDNNVDFYNEVFSGRSFGGLILHECETDKVTWIDEEIIVEGGRIIPDNNGEFQTFTGVFNFQTKPDQVDGNIFNEPAGIFD